MGHGRGALRTRQTTEVGNFQMCMCMCVVVLAAISCGAVVWAWVELWIISHKKELYGQGEWGGTGRSRGTFGYGAHVWTGGGAAAGGLTGGPTGGAYLALST
eukprot:scaffold94185_cov31-Tisochrysis_lutea.AAC.1